MLQVQMLHQHPEQELEQEQVEPEWVDQVGIERFRLLYMYNDGIQK